MSSYPSRLKEFKKWAKAMEEGAKVGNPAYGASSRKPRRSSKKRFKKFRSRKKKLQD